MFVYLLSDVGLHKMKSWPPRHFFLYFLPIRYDNYKSNFELQENDLLLCQELSHKYQFTLSANRGLILLNSARESQF